MLYAVVDIETTGGYASGNGITEIAIVIHDGKEILHFYETLINPQHPIPYFIQSLTGITNDMVAHAPVFNEVAAQIYELLQDKVFVAHNVNFDYSFVKYHLQEAGYALNEKKLCTVRLARKILPGYKSYSLSKLCHQVGLNIANAHRAGGDAMATAQLFTMLVENDNEGTIEGMLKGRNKEMYLPPNVSVEQFENLPPKPGVYYFYDDRGKIIYVGKAKNIGKRIRGHFSNNKPNKQKQDFLREIYSISYKETATELMAHILESTEIRRLWPVRNRSQRGYLPRFGLFVYEDRQGYKRFGIEKNKHYFRPVYTFNSIAEGHSRLRTMISEFGLCPRLCNLAKVECDANDENCTGTCKEDPSLYNQNVEKAIEWLQQYLPSFALVDKGIKANEQSCILMKQGGFYGMGYVNDEQHLTSIDMLEQKLEPYQDTDYIRNLIYKHAATYPERVISLSC
jgi:DNA polymerase-3 subunit epsilon